MDIRYIIAALLVVGVVLGYALWPRTHAPTTMAPQSWSVTAGMDAEDGALQALRFLPEQITIHAGDSVAWKLNSKEEHTVYFAGGEALPPLEMTGADGRVYFNSDIFFASADATGQVRKVYDGVGSISGGMLAEGTETYTLEFTKPGVYEYVCMFHPGMKGTVTVLSVNQPLPQTQAAYEQIARSEGERALQKAHEMHQQMLQPETTSRADGTKEYMLDLMGDIDTASTVLAFGPSPLHIHVGDTVTWKMSDFTELHTVTFPENPEELPEFVMPEPQENGPPKLLVNPDVLKPVGDNNHAGNGYFNSGFLFRAEGQETPTYSLTFTQTGTYEYFCLVHTTAKMKGTIIVESAQSSE
jgi:plastocyanin